MDQIKNQIKIKIGELSKDLFAISEWLKANPETAYHEVRACEHLGEALSQHGFDVERGAGGVETAFVARPSKPKSTRPNIAFLAEYDALPEIGHACGHNMIAAASLGAAFALKEILGDSSGCLTVVGTPAEEGGGGKAKLAEAGIFEEIDAAMMFHPASSNLPGKDFLSRIKFKLEFFGKAAHASGSPDRGLNALDGLVCAYVGMNSLRQHLKADGRIHGIITHGGQSPNTIPDYTAGVFYVRAGTVEYRDELFERVKKCAEGAALATGTEFKIEIDQPVLDSMKRNAALEAAAGANMEALGLSFDEDDGRRGSSDIGNLSHYLPAIHPLLAIVDPDSGFTAHSVEFRDATTTPRGREALLNAAAMLAFTAYDFLMSEDLRNKVKADFNQAI